MGKFSYDETFNIDDIETIFINAERSKNAYQGNAVCTVRREGNEIAIIFRGTDGWREWVSNLTVCEQQHFKLYTTPFTLWDEPQWLDDNRRVHSDWQKTLEECCKKIIREVLGGKELNNVTPSTYITITGHSRGGALATLCAAQLLLKPKLQGIQRVKLVTFATPRSGNDEFYGILQRAIVMRQLSFYRVEHVQDFVASLLPNIGKKLTLLPNIPNRLIDSFLEVGKIFIFYYHKMERYYEEVRKLYTDYCIMHSTLGSNFTGQIRIDIQRRQRARANEIERTRKSTDCCKYCLRHGNLCFSGGEKFHQQQRVKLQHLIAEDRKLTQIENQQLFDATKYGVNTTRMSKETRDEVVKEARWRTIQHRHFFCVSYGTCKESSACRPTIHLGNMVTEYVEEGFAKRDIEKVLELLDGCNTLAREFIEEHPVFEGKREAAEQELKRRHHERIDIVNRWSASFRPDTNNTGSTCQVYTALGVEVNSCLPHTGLRQLAISTYNDSMWKLEETDNRLKLENFWGCIHASKTFGF